MAAVYLETVLVLASNDQAEVLCGAGGVVSENQLLLAENKDSCWLQDLRMRLVQFTMNN